MLFHVDEKLETGHFDQFGSSSINCTGRFREFETRYLKLSTELLRWITRTVSIRVFHSISTNITDKTYLDKICIIYLEKV